MSIVVDANVLKAYFEKTVLDIEETLTGCPILVFDNGPAIYLDQSDHIEHEWKSLVDPEWFDSWLASKLALGEIDTIEVKNCSDLCKKVYRLGFPKGSKDIWYLRTAKEVSDAIASSGNIVTEDIDFFDPKKKATTGKARVKVLTSKSSAMRKTLKKEENIEISCVAEYLA